MTGALPVEEVGSSLFSNKPLRAGQSLIYSSLSKVVPAALSQRPMPKLLQAALSLLPGLCP